MTFKRGDRATSLITGASYEVIADDLELGKLWVISDTGVHIIGDAKMYKKYERPIQVGDVIFASHHNTLSSAPFAYRVIAMIDGHPEYAVAVYAKSAFGYESEAPIVIALDEGSWKVA